MVVDKIYMCVCLCKVCIQEELSSTIRVLDCFLHFVSILVSPLIVVACIDLM